MESTLQMPAFAAGKTGLKTKTIVYWMVTGLFCLQMSFTAYAQLRLPMARMCGVGLQGPSCFGGSFCGAECR